MNLRILSIFCVILTIVFFFCGCSGDKAPRIKFSERIFKFGEINEGEKVEHTFTFLNAGTETLLITDVKATCGCTVPGNYTKEVEPGKSGQIPVVFNSTGFQGDVIKTITVTTNIPDSEPVNLSLEGSIKILVELSTRTIRLGQTKIDGPPLSGSVVIINHTETPMEITGVEINDPQAVTNISTIKQGKEYAVEVTVSPPFRPEQVNKPLKIKTNIKGKEEFEINYHYYGVADIEVAPDKIVVYQQHLNPDLTRIMTVRNYTEGYIEVMNLRTNGKNLDVTEEILVPGKHVQLILHFKDGFTFPENEDLYVFFTIKNEQGETEYSIPVINGETL